MASYTPNYNLKKPADSDSYDIADHNGNMDKIDTALNTLNSKIATFGTIVSIKDDMTDGAYTVNHDFTQYRYLAVIYSASAYYRQIATYPVAIATGSGKWGYDNLLDSSNRCYCLKTNGASTSSMQFSISIPSSGTWSGGHYELIGIK